MPRSGQRRQQDARCATSLHEEPLQAGAVVYVRQPNHTNKKFVPSFVGPYKVDGQAQNAGKHANYSLRTPSGALLQRRYPLDQLYPMTSALAADRIWSQVATGTKRADIIYDADCVLDHRPSQARTGRMEYLVRWTGFTTDFDSWEKEDSLLCPKLLHDYYGLSAATAQPSTARRADSAMDQLVIRALRLSREAAPHQLLAAPPDFQSGREEAQAYTVGLDLTSHLRDRLGAPGAKHVSFSHAPCTTSIESTRSLGADHAQSSHAPARTEVAGSRSRPCGHAEACSWSRPCICAPEVEPWVPRARLPKQADAGVGVPSPGETQPPKDARGKGPNPLGGDGTRRDDRGKGPETDRALFVSGTRRPWAPQLIAAWDALHDDPARASKHARGPVARAD